MINHYSCSSHLISISIPRGQTCVALLIFYLLDIIYRLCPKCSVLSLSRWSWRTCYLSFSFWLIYPLSWCVPKLTTHLGCLVILNWPHTSIFLWLHVFPDRSHISQRGENVITQKWSSRLLAPFLAFFLKFSIIYP